MKVFISHSSLDQWIARMIARDLEVRGIVTFLDEKDIETGESIDDSIQEHLRTCDEVLMLLSPAALESHWVLVEIGGAKALNKRLIPILVHVGPNELPQPIAKGLARDLNDVEKYFDEVEQRARLSSPVLVAELDSTDDYEGLDLGYLDLEPMYANPDSASDNLEPASEEAQAVALATEAEAKAAGRVRRTFKAGDIVKIPEQVQREFVTTSGIAIRWTDDMTVHAGKTAVVTRSDRDRTVLLDVDHLKWWAMDWLEPV